MFKIPWFVFGKKKLLLAFEYGVILSQVAQEQKVEMTKELVEAAEEMIVGEFPNQSATFLSTNMIPNILTAFKLDIRDKAGETAVK